MFARIRQRIAHCRFSLPALGGTYQGQESMRRASFQNPAQELQLELGGGPSTFVHVRPGQASVTSVLENHL